MDKQAQSNPTPDKKFLAALSYMWVASIVVLSLKENRFVRAHAKQGLLLFIGECVIFIPLLGMLIGWFIVLISIILAFVGFFKALQGEEWKVPIVGDWWDKKIQL